MCVTFRNVAVMLLVASATGILQSCGGVSNSTSPMAPPSSPAPPAPPAPPPPSQTPVLAPFVNGLSGPVGFVPVNDGSGRFFVLEQSGTIRIIRNGRLSPGFFLDISAKVNSGGEKGLLGLAFHPQYVQNGRFFLNYTRLDANGKVQSVIAEYRAATNPDLAEPASERILLVVDQPFDNHKGGQLAFGPDGFLYIGFGDGGNANDMPFGNGQSIRTLLGKILRIDVNSSSPPRAYGIPGDNPFVTSADALPEIWAYGLRNPWRFSFDGTGRLFAGDVGQDHFEEIDLIQGGGNYGWNLMEGPSCFTLGCNHAGLILPISSYDHTEGTAVIGGYVYAGTALPQLQGAYIFGDLSGGRIWTLRESAPGTWTRSVLFTTSLTISSFGQDLSGEVFVVDYGTGAVLKLAAQ